MCPACWATLLASYGVLLAVSAVTIVGTDRIALPLAALLALLWCVHAPGGTPLSWWWFPLVGAALLGRVATLLVCRPQDLLVAGAWRVAAAFAAARCPTKGTRRAVET